MKDIMKKKIIFLNEDILGFGVDNITESIFKDLIVKLDAKGIVAEYKQTITMEEIGFSWLIAKCPRKKEGLNDFIDKYNSQDIQKNILLYDVNDDDLIKKLDSFNFAGFLDKYSSVFLYLGDQEMSWPWLYAKKEVANKIEKGKITNGIYDFEKYLGIRGSKEKDTLDFLLDYLDMLEA